MSYSKGWTLIRTAEKRWDAPLWSEVREVSMEEQPELRRRGAGLWIKYEKLCREAEAYTEKKIQRAVQAGDLNKGAHGYFKY